MQKPRELNGHSNPKGEKSKVVVKVVKHMKRCVNLGLKLTKITCEKDHGKTSSEEDVDDPVRKTPESGSFNRTSGHVHAENDDDNHELTSQKVSVEVISTVGDGSTLVCKRVGVLVKFLVHGGKSDKGSLSSFNHGQPSNGNPDHNVSKSGVNFFGNSCLSVSDQPHKKGDREGKKDSGIDCPKDIEGTACGWHGWRLFCKSVKIMSIAE